LLWQNDDAHMASLANYGNSDEFDKQTPEFKMAHQQHYLAHIQNKANKMAIAGAIQGMGAEAGGQEQQGNEQVSPQQRQAEGQRRGNAAAANRPQPPGGNQYAAQTGGRRGMSPSAQQRRRTGRTR